MIFPSIIPSSFLGVPPANTVAPVVSGGKSVGLTFSTTNGTWTGSPSFTYQWTRDGSNISSATASTYVMVAADIGTAIGCTVTGTNGAGNASASSNTITGISWVTSIQTVSITLATLETSHTATITAVSANAFIVFGGFTCTNSTAALPDGEFSRIELTNSTTVTAFRNTGIAVQTATIVATIIDPGADLVENVQQGTITMASVTSNTATITSVDTTRSAVFWLGGITAALTSSGTQWKGGVTLTNATTVTANKNSAGTANTTFGFVVVQFKAQAIKRLQRFNAQFTSTTTAENDTTITAVTTANAIIAHGGTDSNSNSFSTNQNYMQITSSTNVAAIRDATASQNITPKFTVVEFIAGVLKSCQRGAILVDSVTSNTATITAVTTAKSVANYTGQTASSASPNEAWANLVLTNTTTATAAKNTASTTHSAVGYEIWEFN